MEECAAMDCVTCPFCSRTFMLSLSAGDDIDDESDRIWCPSCMRSFDPYARPDPGATASQTASLDELIDGGDEDEEGESTG
jgi:hypothetical protein